MNADTIRLRPAEATDFDYVARLMNEALTLYYGGDHIQHARRIFETHIAGGTDKIGFFSREQRMFIAEIDGERVGLVHLVAKRQCTCKISPLIVDPRFRGGRGVGTALARGAEDYARSIEARQIYCTVAESNSSAVKFFRASGYVVAGSSESHYKAGITELMLYKYLQSEDDISEFDRTHISVLPMEKSQEPQVREILLRHLPQHFVGIDDDWINRLFQGHDRRHQRDINQKYKLMFAATDRTHRVLGVAGATPKKGEPIKIMPLVAEEAPAFFALLSDIPRLLASYGRKIYVHIVPTSDETRFLQKAGWTLDGMMPDAYQPGIVTQQWGLELNEATLMRTMRLKQRYLNFIRKGQKTLEVRVSYDNIKNIAPGEKVRFLSRDDELVKSIRDVRTYKNFSEMLAKEDAEKIVPGINRHEVESLLREIYPSSKESLGVIVLELS